MLRTLRPPRALSHDLIIGNMVLRLCLLLLVFYNVIMMTIIISQSKVYYSLIVYKIRHTHIARTGAVGSNSSRDLRI